MFSDAHVYAVADDISARAHRTMGTGAGGVPVNIASRWDVTIRPCRHGQGLFAARPFATNETILVFEGPIITFERMVSKGEAEANPLQIDRDAFIDLEPPGIYANHSCRPNAGIRDDRVLVARHPIERGDEIVYDYSTTMWEEHWTMQCRCGEIECRGLIEDFPQLSHALQQAYLREGIVQEFIRRRLQLVTSLKAEGV